MPLTSVPIRPGFNKQVTETGAEGQWVDGDNVRFRYGLPEKIGGWQQLTTSTFAGQAREQHMWTDLNGRQYAAIGTDKLLLVYYSNAFYDITPLASTISGGTFTSVNGSATVTINVSGSGINAGDFILLDSVTLPGGGATGFSVSDFTTNAFEVQSATFASVVITMPSNETGTGMTAAGAVSIKPYVDFGPATQTFGYGFGTGLYGGTVTNPVQTSLNGALNPDTAGTGGSGTSITLNSVANLPTSGVVLVGNELITYSGISSNDLTGITRGANGTATPGTSNGQAHSNGATVTDASNFTGFGSSSGTSSVILEPANWTLDNFGQQLVATVKNGNTFSWNPIAANTNALTTRAVKVTNAPTASVGSVVSERDRHLIIFGTETTIGTTSSQDKLFIRFSDQEDINTYAPTSTNTAGTFRLDSGTKIVGAAKGKDYILILTDTAAYVMQFVGPPFTFSIRQVGSNCGAIGQHSMRYVDGKVYWMGQAGGFFVYDGTVKSLPCLVEDFVFTTDGDNLGIQFSSAEIVYAGYNTLYSEINWFYPKSGSTIIDRVVTYNYSEGVWTTGTLDRTTYYDASLFENPYATKFNSTGVPTFPTINGVTNSRGSSIYYAHEQGTNEVAANGTSTAIVSFIKSGDFDLDIQGNGQFFISMRRFVPDFKVLTGDAKISILLKDFPVDNETSSPLGPFTIDSSTTKVDTRARARFASLRVENTSVNQSWRYGTFRADTQPDGQR
tara:strand:- start:1705 stop:3897 length:2193 start_codon:yes stop_codon:yes gene_type:complete